MIGASLVRDVKNAYRLVVRMKRGGLKFEEMKCRVFASNDFAMDEKQASTTLICLLGLELLPHLPGSTS